VLRLDSLRFWTTNFPYVNGLELRGLRWRRPRSGGGHARAGGHGAGPGAVARTGQGEVLVVAKGELAELSPLLEARGRVRALRGRFELQGRPKVGPDGALDGVLEVTLRDLLGGHRRRFEVAAAEATAQVRLSGSLAAPRADLGGLEPYLGRDFVKSFGAPASEVPRAPPLGPRARRGRRAPAPAGRAGGRAPAAAPAGAGRRRGLRVLQDHRHDVRGGGPVPDAPDAPVPRPRCWKRSPARRARPCPTSRLLSFRELPAVLDCLRRLSAGRGGDRRRPGPGAPARFGLACHLGVILGIPTAGCAKSVLVGEFREPAARRGSRSPMRHRGQISAWRCAPRRRPAGLRVGRAPHRPGRRGPAGAGCTAGFRLPEPARLAHALGTRARLAAEGHKSGMARWLDGWMADGGGGASC